MDKDSTGNGPGPVARGLTVPAPEDQESRTAPSIPSFASLRDTRRRSPVDLLLSREDAVVEPPPPSPRPPAPRLDVAVEPAPPSPRPQATRPPEWADLWYLGLRVARWCMRQPLTTARRLLG